MEKMMLIERVPDNADNLAYMEFKNVKKETIPWLEKIAAEYKCKIEKKEWKSKYNCYVVYDYEPFCSDGFEISVTVSSPEVEFLNFVRYLYEIKMQTINHLNNCILI